MRLHLKLPTEQVITTEEERTVVLSPMRQHLLNFIKLDYDAEYAFDVPEDSGRRLIQHMRVKLSKLKQRAIKLKKVPREFRMLVKSFETKDGRDYIVLLKTANGITSLTEDLAEITKIEGLTF